MTEHELKKLSRQDLLEMLIAQSREMQALQERLTAAETALSQKQIHIDNAGSIAEASLSLSGIFEAAQEACKQYTDNIENLSKRQEEVCAQREKESKEKARRLLTEALRQKERLERETRANCEEMTRKAKEESQEYWNNAFRKLNAFLSEHAELRKILSAETPKK